MLRSLSVRDLAVARLVELDLDGPFVVLTGETGAGKSLLVDALTLIAGGRANASAVRTGAKRLLVEAVFELTAEGALAARLEEAGIAHEGAELVLRREVAAGGRSRAWVNGSSVGIGFLADIAGDLLLIRGQSEAPDLAEPARSLAALDRYAGLEADRQELSARLAAHRALAERLERLRSGEREREGKLDFARFQLAEIETVSPHLGEDAELTNERNRLAHAERIRQAAGDALERLESDDAGIAVQLSAMRRALSSAASVSPEIEEAVREVDELALRFGDLGRRLGSLGSELEADPRRLEAVEDRLEKLRRLMRKHGDSVAAVLAQREILEREIAELGGASSEIGRLGHDVEAALAAYLEQADRLSAARRAAAPKLARAVGKHLADLAMPGAALELRVGVRAEAGSPVVRDGGPVAYGAHGYDHAQFFARLNPGEELRPLAQVASGGELSRLQLALQLALHAGAKRSRGTFVFDEIDAGIGGAAAVAVGKKLQSLAKSSQVLCVTHLATIAARAGRHYAVSKASDGARTEAEAHEVAGDARVDELARMLAGEPSAKAAREHARELLREAE